MIFTTHYIDNMGKPRSFREPRIVKPDDETSSRAYSRGTEMIDDYPNNLTGQMTIFDFLPVPTDLDMIPEEEMVRIIEERTRLTFKYNDKFEGLECYETKLGKGVLSIRYENYFESVNNGARFIGVDWMTHGEGSCGPRDSIDEAVGFIKKIMEKVERAKRRKEDNAEAEMDG